ncbi:hypothetical protein KAT92_01760 [Candidatus Babeliales bacterium]|nr:hypothetical protein [Candidatus Babeliales bacterium]
MKKVLMLALCLSAAGLGLNTSAYSRAENNKNSELWQLQNDFNNQYKTLRRLYLNKIAVEAKIVADTLKAEGNAFKTEFVGAFVEANHKVGTLVDFRPYRDRLVASLKDVQDRIEILQKEVPASPQK